MSITFNQALDLAEFFLDIYNLYSLGSTCNILDKFNKTHGRNIKKHEC